MHIEQFEQAINANTILISCMAVNNESGAIQPIEELAKLKRLRAPQALLHVDAVQALSLIHI